MPFVVGALACLLPPHPNLTIQDSLMPWHSWHLVPDLTFHEVVNDLAWITVFALPGILYQREERKKRREFFKEGKTSIFEDDIEMFGGSFDREEY
eukprot:g33059.t1